VPFSLLNAVESCRTPKSSIIFSRKQLTEQPTQVRGVPLPISESNRAVFSVSQRFDLKTEHGVAPPASLHLMKKGARSHWPLHAWKSQRFQNACGNGGRVETTRPSHCGLHSGAPGPDLARGSVERCRFRPFVVPSMHGRQGSTRDCRGETNRVNRKARGPNSVW